jgi:HSP20 family molecular chaperone IbpA
MTGSKLRAGATSRVSGASGDAEEASRAAQRAQLDASRQIEAASKSVEEARHEADTQIDHIHDDYDHRSEIEQAREAAAFEKERLKGYERLQDLKRGQQAEIRRTRHEGERELDKLNQYYTDTSYNTQTEGDRRLQDLRAVQARELERAQMTKNDDVKLAQDTFQRDTEEVRAAHSARLAKLQEDTSSEYERIKSTSAAATEQADSSFKANYETRIQRTNQELADLENRASESLRETRRDTTEKLAAYSKRQKDPFYRMKDLDARVEEDGDAYVLTATIPEHEQAHVSVSVKGGQLVLSGTRRSAEKLDDASGHSQSTNTFQSYLETFPIQWPVDQNRLTRRFEGDQLIVRVPKRTERAYRSEAQEKARVARARVERPRFPDNLPHVSQDSFKDPYAGQTPGEGVAAPDPRRKTRGSGTLA